MGSVKRSAVAVLVVLMVASALLSPIGAMAKTPKPTSTQCSQDQDWLAATIDAIDSATKEATGYLDAGDATSALLTTIAYRHKIAGLEFNSTATAMRAGVLAWFDEMIYQSATLVVDPSSFDSSALDVLQKKSVDAIGAIASACSLSSST